MKSALTFISGLLSLQTFPLFLTCVGPALIPDVCRISPYRWYHIDGVLAEPLARRQGKSESAFSHRILLALFLQHRLLCRRDHCWLKYIAHMGRKKAEPVRRTAGGNTVGVPRRLLFSLCVQHGTTLIDIKHVHSTVSHSLAAARPLVRPLLVVPQCNDGLSPILPTPAHPISTLATPGTARQRGRERGQDLRPLPGRRRRGRGRRAEGRRPMVVTWA